MSERKDVPISFGISRKSLEGIKIFACSKCEAPGIYKSDTRTAQFWPGCWNPQLANRPVGAICPNCGAVRRKDRNLGELSASMPRWIWMCVLGVKWCVVKLATFNRNRREAWQMRLKPRRN